VNQEQQDQRHENQLRFTFVAMLFALTIGEIAIRFAQLAAGPQVRYYPAYAHLILAGFIVVTSWVGWAQSKAPGNVKAVSQIFSLEFIVLLIDVSLVFCYFIIVKGAEMPEPKSGIKASANNETFWIMVVFAGYLLWDIWTKAVIKPQSDSGFVSRLRSPYFLKNLLITAGCLLLAVIIRVITRSLGVLSNAGVISIDVALIILVGLFRLLKQLVGRENRAPIVP
jgi:hypothetical protein